MPQWDVASSPKNSTNLDPSAAFGQLLRKHRLRLKMSQEALAAKSGYERALISLIELGKTNPSLRSIFHIEVYSTSALRCESSLRCSCVRSSSSQGSSCRHSPTDDPNYPQSALTFSPVRGRMDTKTPIHLVDLNLSRQ